MEEMTYIKNKMLEANDHTTYGGYEAKFEKLFMQIEYAINHENEEIETLKNSDK
jgi:hypothetical protein